MEARGALGATPAQSNFFERVPSQLPWRVETSWCQGRGGSGRGRGAKCLRVRVFFFFGSKSPHSLEKEWGRFSRCPLGGVSAAKMVFI